MIEISREFEWDEGKRIATIEKHGIDFRDAALIFADRCVVKKARSETEKRYRATGLLNGAFVTVVFTMRGDVVRLVTARRARHDEIRAYREIHAL